jgi:Ni/Co efflux regulator RcnB
MRQEKKMKKLIGATLALTLLGATAAVAQPYGYDRNDRGIYDNRGFDWNNRDGRFYDGRDFNWRRGMMFRNHGRFVVRDWWRHGLYRPNRNQHWVQHGRTFLLVNRRGIVVDVVFRPRFGQGYGYGGARF